MRELYARTFAWCRARPDAAAAIVLAVASLVILAATGGLTPPASAAVSSTDPALAALVAWRRRWPVAMNVLAGVLIAVPHYTSYASAAYTNAINVPGIVIVFLLAFALGSQCEWLWSLLGLVPLTVGLVLSGGSGFNPFFEMVTVGPWFAGWVFAARRRAAQDLQTRARELEEERELFARQSVRYERARIARELHDVVAHSVSLMVVQANAGAQLAHDDPRGAAEAFATISETAREAEAEIDRLVELLDTSSAASPPAGLRIVEELVRRVQASGLQITCQFTGDGDRLSERSAETAYRIVQEAVTNAMKHAPGAAIDVAVVGEDHELVVRVANRRAATRGAGLEDAGGGHGLSGMRERVGRCGGRIEVGPTGDGGWSVLARLPRFPATEPALSASPGVPTGPQQ
jgi:signal transduction histidine kinase